MYRCMKRFLPLVLKRVPRMPMFELYEVLQRYPGKQLMQAFASSDVPAHMAQLGARGRDVAEEAEEGALTPGEEGDEEKDGQGGEQEKGKGKAVGDIAREDADSDSEEIPLRCCIFR